MFGKSAKDTARLVNLRPAGAKKKSRWTAHLRIERDPWIVLQVLMGHRERQRGLSIAKTVLHDPEEFDLGKKTSEMLQLETRSLNGAVGGL